MKGWLFSITRPRVDNRNELVLARFPGGRKPWPRRGARSWSPAQQLLQSAGSEGKLTALEFISGNLSPNYFQFFTMSCRQWSSASLCKQAVSYSAIQIELSAQSQLRASSCLRTTWLAPGPGLSSKASSRASTSRVTTRSEAEKIRRGKSFSRSSGGSGGRQTSTESL